jgi:hypothetical protein
MAAGMEVVTTVGEGMAAGTEGATTVEEVTGDMA